MPRFSSNPMILGAQVITAGLLLVAGGCDAHALSKGPSNSAPPLPPPPPQSSSQSAMSRRAAVRTFIVRTAGATTAAAPFLNSDAFADEGISAVTDSSFGKAVRRSAVRGARLADNLDERWERFSDGLRDTKGCDPQTGRRLFDNGFRKDGTRVGDPVLGALCNPEPLQPLDEGLATRVLDLAVRAALECGGGSGAAAALERSIRETEELVRPSFERTIQNAADEEDGRRKRFNFSFYSKMRAIESFLGGSRQSIRMFQIAWGKELVSDLAPLANRNDYTSPFLEKKDEFQDYDYDKNLLLDGLGALRVSLDKLKAGGLLGYFELSIPYDDYGSVVTVAIDDYAPISSEILLSEQKYAIAGPAQALVRYVMQRAGLDFALDTFYIDPSTTKQSIYNPTQLLLSLNNLRNQ